MHPTRERGRPARMHSRYVPLSFPAMGHPATLRGNGMGLAEAESWRHPGTRASRPHAVPLLAAQFPLDVAPGHPAWKRHGLGRSRVLAPPGNAGFSPACCPVAWRSVSPRCGARSPCRPNPHGPGRNTVLTPLPVDPGRGDGQGCGTMCAGGTPALPGGLHPMTSSQHLPAFLTGQRAGPSRCCSTFPTAPARTESRSPAKPSAAPPVRR